MRDPIYLDYNATTPLDPSVREAMLPFLDSLFGNPSSFHHVGRRVRVALDEAVDNHQKHDRHGNEVAGMHPTTADLMQGPDRNDHGKQQADVDQPLCARQLKLGRQGAGKQQGHQCGQ